MTLRQLYEAALIECNKLKAPALLLEDYIYLINKAIQQKANEIYNRYDINQQSSDDLRVLQTTATIENPSHNEGFSGNVWSVELPKDYLHLLNCVAEFSGENPNSGKCDTGILKTIVSGCQRLTADLYGGIINNYYMKPSHKKPYYYIINNNENPQPVTNPTMDNEVKRGDGYLPAFTKTDGGDGPEYRFYALKEQFDRTSNQSTVRLEIHSGKGLWTLDKVYITYLKSPMYVSMTQEDLMKVEDTTQVLEFPDYMCYEIINTFVKLLLENASDPRLQTQLAVNQSIAIPGRN